MRDRRERRRGWCGDSGKVLDKDRAQGFDAQTGEFKDLVKAGIIDLTMVRSALERRVDRVADDRHQAMVAERRRNPQPVTDPACMTVRPSIWCRVQGRQRCAADADPPLRCKSSDSARRTAENLVPTKAGVVAFSTSGDATWANTTTNPRSSSEPAACRHRSGRHEDGAEPCRTGRCP